MFIFQSKWLFSQGSVLQFWGILVSYGEKIGYIGIPVAPWLSLTCDFSDCFTCVSFLCSTCVTSSLNFTGWSTKSTRKHLVLFRWFGDNYYPICTVFWKRCFSSQHPIKTQSNMTMYRELLRSRELWREDMWCKLNFPEERELITKEWLKNSGFVRLRGATHSLLRRLI